MTLFDTLNPGRGRRRLMLAVAMGALLGLPFATQPALANIGGPPKHDTKMPSGVANLLRQARQAMKQGHPNVAVIYLQNAIKLAPKNTNIRMELGFAYMRSGNMQSAVRQLRTARSDGAPAAKVLPLLYDAMLAHGEAQRILDQFPAPSAGDHTALAAATLRARGLAQLKLGHLEQARPDLDRALAIRRDVPNLAARAQLAKSQNDMKMALHLAKAAYSKAPREANVLLLLVSLEQQAGHPKQALGYAGALVKAYPTFPVALLSRAGVYMQLNQDAKARKDVDAALARAKYLPQARYYKALLLERAKDHKGAWGIAQTLPADFINSRKEIGPVIAQMALADGHRTVAIVQLSNAIMRFPDYPESRVYLAALYLQHKQAKKALNTLLPIKDSDAPRAMALLGQSYAMLGRFAKATEYFEKAGATGFGGDLLKRQIAASSLGSGDLDTALKQLRALNAKNPADAVTAGLLVTTLLRTHNLPEATKVADRLTAKAPKNPYGPLFQGQIFLARGDFNKAIGAFSHSARIAPKFVPALYDRAVARAARGDVKGANADIRAVLKASPKNTMAMIRGAELSMRMHQDRNALNLLKRAVATEPKSATTNLALTSFYVMRKRWKDASGAVHAYLKRVPGDANAQAIQAEIQMATGRLDPALATFKRLAAAHPKSPQLQMLLGSALAGKKNVNGALAAYRRSVQLAPKFGAARATLIRYALANHRGNDAIAAAEDGVREQPGPQSDLVLASTLSALKKYGRAQGVLKASLAKHPSEAAVIMSSQLYRKTRRPREADAVLRRWMAKHPGDVGARLEFAQHQMEANPAAAEAQFRIVLKKQPKNVMALNNLSWLLQKRNPKQAVAYAEQAARQAPGVPAVLDTLGWVKWHAKDSAGALDALKKAYAADKSPEIGYHLAVVLHGTGHHVEAKKTLNNVLASNQPFSERHEAEALVRRWR